MKPASSIHFRAKRHQCQFRQLKMLKAKGNPYDGHTQDASEYSVFQRQRQAGQDQPDNIYQKGNCPAPILHIFSKRKKAEGGKFKTLHSYRDSHNSDAPEASGKTPA